VPDAMVNAITSEAQAAVRAMVAEARTAATTITADAQRAAVATIASVQQSVTGAVSDAAQKISTNFATLVNDELTEMNENFKKSHPEVTQAVTDVVGYSTAVKEVSTSMREAADAVKGLPETLTDIREGLKGTVEEARNLGKDLRTMGTEARTALSGFSQSGGTNRAFAAIRAGADQAMTAVKGFGTQARGVATSVGPAVRSLTQLTAAYAKAAVQTALNTVRTVAMNAAQKLIAVGTKLWAGAQALLNLAMRMNPVGLIITAITVLVGLLVLAYTRSNTFRAIVQTAMRGVTTAIGWVVAGARAVVDWIKVHWPLLLGILTGPIGMAVLLVVKNWDKIKDGAAAVKDSIGRSINTIVGWVTGLGGRISAGARGMWDGIKEAFRGSLNWVIHAWNSIQFKIPSFSLGPAHFGGFTLDLPHVQALAEGGLVPHRPGGVLALLGEGREDELVIPLSRLGQVAGGLAKNVTVNVYPRPGQSEQEIGRIAARELAWAAKY
jgi:vacuolar-type H+-ATPase subunit E/Vma4